jgi:hypothetical protein
MHVVVRPPSEHQLIRRLGLAIVVLRAVVERAAKMERPMLKRLHQQSVVKSARARSLRARSERPGPRRLDLLHWHHKHKHPPSIS